MNEMEENRMDLEDKKILVTGGAGFIGSNLVNALMKERCFVRVLDNLRNGKFENIAHHINNENFEFQLGSVTDSFSVKRAMQDIDIVYHLACLGVRHSIGNPIENHCINAEGTLKVLEQACQDNVRRFIYCSSSEVYGTAEFVPMNEKHPTRPCTIYGASKLAGEAYTRTYCHTYGLKAIIIRPFNTYGPYSHHEGDAGELIPKSIVRGLNNRPILLFGDGRQMRDFTYVTDTAKGLILAAKTNELVGLTANIGNDKEISIKKIAEIILDQIKSSTQDIKFTDSRPGDVLQLYADSTLFRNMTGWKPEIQIEEGITNTINWFKSRPEGVKSLLSQEKGINWVRS
ncbi:MAG: GDP-mannose 4,6-dehydratase [Candidatus Heimdallarchaeota archaeon]